MKESTSKERESFFDGLNQDLLQIFDEDVEIDPEFKFPLSHEAMSDEEGEHTAQILSEIGRGGMKVIFKCRVPNDGKILALATMKNKGKQSSVERFLKEAKITQTLNHFNIIRIYDYGINDRYGPYMAMNYVDGESLSNVITRLSKNDKDTLDKYNLSRRLKIFKDVSSAISYAHSKGIVHLDLKPENILIDKSGRVYICDWGLAKMLPEYETVETANLFASSSNSGIYFKGSPGYMAPEQISQKEKNIRTDIYQLGAILYSMIFFRAPVEGDNVDEVLEKTVMGNIELPDEDNSTLLKVMKVALKTDPAQRFSSVDELLKILNNIIIFSASKLKTTIRKDKVKLKINPNVKRRRPKRKKNSMSPALIMTLCGISLFILWTLVANRNQETAYPDNKVDKFNQQINSDKGVFAPDGGK